MELKLKLEKAAKLKVASERGDIEIRDFARAKYQAFLIRNDISQAQVIEFENNNGKIKKSVKIKCFNKEFLSMEDFKIWYGQLGFFDKLKVAAELGFNKPPTEKDKYYF